MTTRQSSITDELRKLLLSGTFPAGQHLEEIPLAQSLGVSRTPVRAALAAMAQEGLLTYRSKRGYVVRAFSLKEIMDAYLIRGTLEGLACRLVAERGLDADAQQVLRACLERSTELLAGGSLTESGFIPWRDTNDRFHQQILKATESSTLIEATERTLAIPFTSSRVVHWIDFDGIRRSHDHHLIIFDALKRRQPARAEMMMVEHIYVASEVVRARFAASGGPAASSA